MTLKNHFCPSPWLHMRINNAGHYEYCRWADKGDRNSGPSIHQVTPIDFFQNHMASVREEFLDGKMPAGCHECAQMEQYGKVSGRQRQLLKIGVRLEYFEKSLASSPWTPLFESGKFDQYPQDWQIDLGNFCNSACVFCDPSASSRLATEWQKIGFIKELPAPNWCEDPKLLQSFIDTIVKSPHIQYLHFIGGETLITPAFKTILEALIDAGLNRKATIGFTTNLSVWREDIADLLCEFQGVNVGMSVEAFDAINDYVRWPVTLPVVKENVDRWIKLGKKQNWLMQFRTTPTCLTVGSLLSVYEYAWYHGIAVESCNFLQEPAQLRPSVLPREYRTPIVEKMQQWVAAHKTSSEQIVNTRDPNKAHQQIVQDLESYVNYLENEVNESHRLVDLVQYLKKLESSRHNSIVDYLPDYEDLFRSAGY